MSNAQYTSIFGINSTKWDAPSCNMGFTNLIQQEVGMNITVDGIDYKKVGTIHSSGISYELNGISANGYIRENTNSGKVWFNGTVETFPSFDTLEYLVMDLSLNVNDTFLIHENMGQIFTSIIDSVYYMSGIKHVQTNYTHWSSAEPLTFIEGVGTNYGFAYMHDSYNTCRCLISFNKDLNEVYSNGNCLPLAGENSVPEPEPEVSVFPNPASTHITIQSKPGDQYEIYSIDGQRILLGTLKTSSMQVNLNKLIPNVYFVQVNSKIFKLIKTE
jgi:hypothetical protein